MCMSKEQPVIYSNRSGLTFLIGPYGIHYKRTKDLGGLEDLLVLYPDLWSLVDPQCEKPLPLSFTVDIPFYHRMHTSFSAPWAVFRNVTGYP